MKKVLTGIAAFLIVLLVAACGDGIFSTPSTGDLMQPDHNYELDTWGSNSEIYEFTPKAHSGKTCVMFMLDSGAAMGLQCFDKPVKTGGEG